MVGSDSVRAAGRPARSLTARVLAATLVVGGALTVLTPAATAEDGPVHAVRGPACPDVMVLAARGSGEAPQGDGADGRPFPAPYANPAISYGVGPVNLEFFDGLVAARPDVTFALDSVMYPAVPVPPLTDLMPFLASTDTGRNVLDGEITRLEQACAGNVRYILAGYSQGAWVIHKALWRLAQQRPALLSRIVGVVLFGDPLFQPNAAIVRAFKAQTSFWSGIATRVEGQFANVPAAVERVSASYCLPGDPICQMFAGPAVNTAAFQSCSAVGWAGVCPHARYGASGDNMTARAVTFLAGRLPGEFTRALTNSFGGEVASCSPDNLWMFELHDIGGSTGINPPTSITARTATGPP